jgi:hypothetical protein
MRHSKNPRITRWAVWTLVGTITLATLVGDVHRHLGDRVSGHGPMVSAASSEPDVHECPPGCSAAATLV